MELKSGTRLGPYEILSPIGAGGMGEVFKSRDTRLDRIVAVKVMPKHIAARPDLRARFEREARTVSNLNHPNICVLHDIGKQDGIDFMVLEYLEGETLAARVAKGPMPLDQVLKYATQIADALDRAHRSGVSHRDVKPANVMITRDGCKVLDFGLAKTAPGIAAPDGPTLTAALTREGAVMGTPQYMAPEQYEGNEADARSDIFAFGCVLYEMLTGKRCFEGNARAGLIAAVPGTDPQPILPDSLLSVAPPALQRLLRRCLAKDPEDRYQSMRDVVLELRSIAEGAADGLARTSLPRLNKVLAITTVVFAALAATMALVHLRETQPQVKLISASIPPPGEAPPDGIESWAAISPDGKNLVFGMGTGDKSQLWLRALDSTTALPIAGTERGEEPFWSPDSRSIGFFADQKLKRIDLPGGAPLTLANAPLGYGGSWSTRGIIVFSPAAFSGLEQVQATGGNATPIALGQRVHFPSFPSFLPDGRHFVFLDLRDSAGSDGVLKIASVDGGEEKSFGPANSTAYFANGRILFLRGNTLISQPFDEQRLEAAQETSPLAQNALSFSASREGTLIYQGGSPDLQQLTWFDRNGTASGTMGEPGSFYTVEFSPDRKKIALSVDDDLWIEDVTRGLRSRFTFAPGIDTNPIWSRDGQNIAFCSNRSGRYGVYLKSSDLSGTEETVYLDSIDSLTDSWSPDDKVLMLHRRDPAHQEDLAVLPLNSGANGAALKLTPFLQTPFRELHARFSPDGRWVAYVSDESQHAEVYVTSFPLPRTKLQISTTGGGSPRWRADGKELFFPSGSGTLMAAEVDTSGDTVKVGAIRSLGIPVVGRGWMYDVSADGQKFLVAVRPKQKPEPLTLVSNWPMLLKK